MTEEHLAIVAAIVRKARAELPVLLAQVRQLQARLGTSDERPEDQADLAALVHKLVNVQTKANAGLC